MGYHKNYPRYEMDIVSMWNVVSKLVWEINITISLQEKNVGYLLVRTLEETTEVQEDSTHVGIENVRYIV